ncbi:MAG TPA: START domain-containing protein [Pseudomonadales bacterium]|nr:START domain-containing protein [Pseudomonadales bacterium]
MRTTRSSAARRIAIAMCLCAYSTGGPIGAFAAAATPATETAEWTELEKANGTVVYTRPFPGSAFPEVRASGDVCATLPQLVAFVEDVAAFEQWIPDTAEARLLERPTPRTQIYYIRTSMPWPVKDRDMIYRLSETAESMTTKISVRIEGLPDYRPVDSRAVRMSGVSGRWSFVQSGGRTRIDLDMHIEPGGGVPNWLARQRIVGTPTKMLTNLKRHFETGCPNP